MAQRQPVAKLMQRDRFHVVGRTARRRRCTPGHTRIELSIAFDNDIVDHTPSGARQDPPITEIFPYDFVDTVANVPPSLMGSRIGERKFCPGGAPGLRRITDGLVLGCGETGMNLI